MFSTEESPSPAEDLDLSNRRRAKRPDDTEETAEGLSFEFGEHDEESDFSLNWSVDSSFSFPDEKLPAVPQVRREADGGHLDHNVLVDHDDEDLTVLEITGILPIDEEMSTESLFPSNSILSSPSRNSDNNISPSRSPVTSTAVTARLVDADEESRVVNERVQKALQKQRERTGVAELVVDNAENAELPNEHATKCWASRKTIRVVLIVTSIITIAAIVSITVLFTRKYKPTPTYVSPVPAPTDIPTMAPTIQNHEPPVYTLPPVMAPTSTSDSRLSSTDKMTTIVLTMIAVGAATLAGLIIYCRQRKQNQTND